MIRHETTAGGKPPAVRDRDRWIDWRVRHDRPVWDASLWPNRSLTPGIRKAVLTFICAGLCLPLIPLIGTLAFWGMVPFLAGTLALILLGLRRSDRDGHLSEEVAIWPDEMRVERREPSGRCLRWSAETMQVRVRLADGPVESYLTLKGGGREIELGRFLSPEERVELAGEIEDALGRAFRR